MKYFLVYSICFFISKGSFAQPLSKEGVVSINASIDELKNRAKDWMVDNTDLVGSPDGVLKGKSSVIYNPTIFYGSSGTKGVIEYVVIITIKDKKYKYEITHFVHQGNPNNPTNLSFGELTIDEECPYHMKGQRKGWENKVWRELKEVANEHSDKVVNSIKEGMSTPSGF